MVMYYASDFTWQDKEAQSCLIHHSTWNKPPAVWTYSHLNLTYQIGERRLIRSQSQSSNSTEEPAKFLLCSALQARPVEREPSRYSAAWWKMPAKFPRRSSQSQYKYWKLTSSPRGPLCLWPSGWRRTRSSCHSCPLLAIIEYWVLRNGFEMESPMGGWQNEYYY